MAERILLCIEPDSATVDQIRRDVGVDRLGLVGVHDCAAFEVLARSAVRGENARQQAAGAGFRSRDGQLAAAQTRLEGLHALLELGQGRRPFRRHDVRA